MQVIGKALITVRGIFILKVIYHRKVQMIDLNTMLLIVMYPGKYELR
jgi:hypothetical protein